MPKETKEANMTKDAGTMFLECVLTEEELKVASKALAEAIQRKTDIDARNESFKTQIKADLAAQDAIILKQSQLVNNETEMRMVPCEVEYDWNKDMKTFFRKDTGVEVRKEAISAGERQMHLDEAQTVKA